MNSTKKYEDFDYENREITSSGITGDSNTKNKRAIYFPFQMYDSYNIKLLD